MHLDCPSLTLNQARALHLAALGLLTPPQTKAGPETVLHAIHQMRALQIDTIHVVARSHYLVLWSRIGDYDPAWLDALLVKGDLFEYWSHAACFLPIEDYPYYRRWMIDGIRGWQRPHQWIEQHRALADAVLERIQNEGPLRSADFENHRGRPSNGWWDWKEEKIALEQLHTAGVLMICERRKFQRIYDLTERVLPDWQDSGVPSPEETLQRLTLNTVRALGVALPGWVPDYFRLPKTQNAARLEAGAAEGQLFKVRVEGWEQEAYVHVDQKGLFDAAARGALVPTLTTFLSPFDPLVWDRARCKSLFDFDYSLECYLPAEKRRYGYFTLPILHCGRLVGRLDAKAYRKEGVFEVRSIHMEAGVEVDEEIIGAVAGALQRCADWHQTPQVRVLLSYPSEVKPALQKALCAA